PERKQDMGRHLDSSSLGVPAVALEASQRSLESITHQLVEIQRRLLSQRADEGVRETLKQAYEGLNEALQFIARLPPLENDVHLHRQRVAQLHAIDHLLRFCGRLQTEPECPVQTEVESLTDVKAGMDRILA